MNLESAISEALYGQTSLEDLSDLYELQLQVSQEAHRCELLSLELHTHTVARDNLMAILEGRPSTESIHPLQVHMINQQLAYVGLDNIINTSMEADDAWEKVKRIVKAIIDGIVNAGRAFINAIRNFFKKLYELVTGLGRKIASVSRSLAEKVGLCKPIVVKHANTLSIDGKFRGDDVKPLLDMIDLVLQKYGSNIITASKTLVTGIKLVADDEVLRQNLQTGHQVYSKLSTGLAVKPGESANKLVSTFKMHGDVVFHLHLPASNEGAFWKDTTAYLKEGDSASETDNEADLPEIEHAELKKQADALMEANETLAKGLKRMDALPNSLGRTLDKIREFQKIVDRPPAEGAAPTNYSELVRENLHLVDALRQQMVRPIQQSTVFTRVMTQMVSVIERRSKGDVKVATPIEVAKPKTVEY